MKTSTNAGIVIVGSANMDVVFTVERIPQPGETLLATSTAKYPGGKGLNQAVAAARAGSATTFIGALGTDDNGRELARTMAEAAIDAYHVRSTHEATGQAFIVVDEHAENTIIVASGANATMTELSGGELSVIGRADVLLLQLELPLAIVAQAARAGRTAGATVILNAAPAHALSDEILRSLDCLIVNEYEACLIGASDVLATAARSLAARVRQVIVTLGGEGALLYEDGTEVARVTPAKVDVVDTTGAGDTFCGAFATAVLEGKSLVDAAWFATAAASLCVQARGAVPSIPERDRIDAALSELQLNKERS